MFNANLSRAVALIWNAASKPVAGIVALTFAQGILPLASLYCLKIAIDTISRGRDGAANAATNVLTWVAISGVLYLLYLAAKLTFTFVNEALVLVVTEKAQEMIAEKSNRMELSYYENPAYFDTLHQAQREAPHRLSRLVGAFCQVLQSTFSLVAIGALLLISVHWTMGVLAALITVPAVILRMRNSRQLYAWQSKQSATERQVSYYEWLLSSGTAAKESRLLDLGKLFANRAGSLRRTLGEQRLRFTLRRLLGDGLSQSAAAVAATAVVGALAVRALNGIITVGDVVMNYQAFQRGVSALQELATGISTIYESQLFVARFFQFLDLPGGKEADSRPVPFPKTLSRGIEFHDVSFAYEGGREILDGVSFHIEPGQMVALVGENGAGKSTLVKLLCGLYLPTRGSITIDGIDIKNFERRELWNGISVLFQDFGKYFVSAEENVWFGDVGRPLDRSRIQRAVEQSGAASVIEDLPRGFDQRLGTLFEGGQELSLGQWQKIALARTFLRETPIIILDEPSSALDVRAEHEVFEMFRVLTRDRTSLVISHRLSTVRSADRIFLLNDGRLAEVGSHDELVNQGGIYADLFATQASSYR
jgi:ATP-binding cassette, subfamily B, bacterial